MTLRPDTPLLDMVETPQDLRQLEPAQLRQLADELRTEIRRRVRAEHEERWRRATWWRRLRLRRAIEREVERRSRRLAPADALW